MSYARNKTLSKKQDELRTLVNERLKNEQPDIRQRVYQWLNDNQYFTDNELFDFYFCVAQNLAAVEILGGSGEKILAAKLELENAARIYTSQVVDISNEISQQLEHQLHSIRENQEKLDIKLVRVLEELSVEQQNLKAISAGLVNSISALSNKQKQLLIQTQAARKLASISVIVAWIIPIITLLGCMGILLLNNK